MEALIERCCGLDVHQAEVVACVLVGESKAHEHKEVRRFRTVTAGLQELARWLESLGCTHVAMESTGVYWMPVFEALEGKFTLVVGNAQRIKNVPGRKSDVKDAEWLADLCRHGLIAPSFVPEKPIRELRELNRFRTRLIEARTDERNRTLRQLELGGVKLSTFATNVFGVSGMRMLNALVEGKLDAEAMADLAVGRLRKKLPELKLALEGRLNATQRLVVQIQLKRLAELEVHLATVEAELAQQLEIYRKEQELLMTIPGVSRVVAGTLIAELGTNMSRFRGPDRLASWVGLCPGTNESAGKHRSSRTRKGNAHLRKMLVQAATAAARTKGTYLQSVFKRLLIRRGYKRSAVAVAHRILLAAYHMLLNGQEYRDLGEAFLDQQDEKRVRKNMVRRLERLGYEVTLTPKRAA